LNAARWTTLAICFSVMRSASAAVMPFSSSTDSVWLKASTVCATANGPISGSLSSQASVAWRPAGVTRQRQSETAPNTSAIMTRRP
jgi:hypothetical protein